MLKTFLAGTTALAIAGATLAYAQQGSSEFQRIQHWRPSAEDIAAFGDARIAALHAGLKLTAEQEKNWPAVESALRDLAKQRSERFAARASADRPKDPVERLTSSRGGDGPARGRPQEARRRGRRRSTRASMIARSIALPCWRGLADVKAAGKAVASADIMALAAGTNVGRAE